MGYLDKALEAIQHEGISVSYFHPVETTLQEIGRGYKPGLIRWIREHPDRWHQLLALESRINEIALSKEDEITLKDALADYKEFFVEMTDL